MANFCKHCGAALMENARFCENCGNTVASAAQRQSQTRTQAAPPQSAPAQSHPGYPAQRETPPNTPPQYAVSQYAPPQSAPQSAPQKKTGGWILPYRIVASVLVVAMLASGLYGVFTRRGGKAGDPGGYDAGTGAPAINISDIGNGSPAPVITSYAPKSGPAGSLVHFTLDKTVDTSKLRVAYSGIPVGIIASIGDSFLVNVPHDASNGEFTLSYGGEAAPASFDVAPQLLEELSRVTVRPSDKAQTIECAEGVTVTIPGGFLDQPRDLTLSGVINPAIPQELTFMPIALYDFSFDGLSALPDYVEVGMPVDIESLRDGLDQYDTDGRLALEDVLRAKRWSAEFGSEVDLPMRLDETEGKVYYLTDHFSPGFVVALVGVAIGFEYLTSTAQNAYKDWLKYADNVYITKGNNFNIFWSDEELKTRFPQGEWDDCASRGGFTRDDYSGAAAGVPHLVADVGAILESALANYIAAGLQNPSYSVESNLLPGKETYRKRVDVKIDSTEAISSGENQTSIFSGKMQISTEVFRNYFKEDATKPGYGATKLTHILAHELFHVIQNRTYGMTSLGAAISNSMDTLFGKVGELVSHKWWIEATAEYAAVDIALKRNGTYLNDNIGALYPTHYIDSVGDISGAYYKDGQENYEYLTGIFIRYLVDVVGLSFNDLYKEPASSIIVSNAVADYAAGKSGKFTVEDIYTGFFEYLVENTTFREALANDFDRSRVTGAFASRIDTVNMESYDGDELSSMVVSFTIEEDDVNGNASESDVLVYRVTADGILSLEAKVHGSEEFRFTAENNDVFYFVAPSNKEDERRPTITLYREEPSVPDGRVTLANSLFNGAPRQILGSPKLTVTGFYTEAWAVYFGRSNWQVNPFRADPVILGQPEEFTLTGHYIDPAITHVLVEWDFGDNQEKTSEYAPLTLSSPINDFVGGSGGGYASIGSAPVKVSNGEVDLKFEYTFIAPTDLAPDLNRASWTYMPQFKIYKSDGNGTKGGELSERSAFANVLLFDVIVPDLVRYNPVFDWVEDSGAGGMTLYLNANGFPNNNGMEYRYEWDFGDGEIFSQTVESGKKAKTEHCYKAPGEYKLTISIFDESGLMGAAVLAKREHKFTLGEPVEKEQKPAQSLDDTGSKVFKLDKEKSVIPASYKTRFDNDKSYSINEFYAANGTWRKTAFHHSEVKGWKTTNTTEIYSVTFTALPDTLKVGDKLTINVNVSTPKDSDTLLIEAYENRRTDDGYLKSSEGKHRHICSGSNNSFSYTYTVPEIAAKYGSFDIYFDIFTGHELASQQFARTNDDVPFRFAYVMEGHGEVTMPDYIEPDAVPDAVEGDMSELVGRYEGVAETYSLYGYVGPPENDPAVTGANRREVALEITEENGKYHGAFFVKGSGGWNPQYSIMEFISYDPVTGRIHTDTFPGNPDYPTESGEYRFSCVLRGDRIVDGEVAPIDRNREFLGFRDIEVNRG